MNWEVWTMPRKTSCCNGTLLRSDVRHYWPAGFLYVLVWLMILPIPLLQTARDYLRFQSEQTVQLAAQLHNHVYAAMTGSLVLAGLAAIPLLFYGYQGVLGRDIMWLDVAIFQIAVLLGFWVTWAMLRRRALASPVWQVAGAAVLAAVWAAFILWTFAPPDLPLFADPETGLRGIR